MITLKTLPQATKQEVFDQVAKHLLAQAKRSADHHGGCYYRSPEGLKCAAGCLIGDDEYSHAIEGGPWDVLAAKGIVPDEHMHMIRQLQNIHDNFKPDLWRRELDKIAHQFNLNTNVLDDHRTDI